MAENILERANNIVNNRSEEGDRKYGDFNSSMEKTAEIYNAMSVHHLDPLDIYKVLIALKLSRERFSHREDNLLDACSYIGAMNNYINEKKEKPNSKFISFDNGMSSKDFAKNLNELLSALPTLHKIQGDNNE